MAVVTKQQLENAAVDATTLETVVNGDVGDTPVTTRLGQELKTLATIEADIEVRVTEALGDFANTEELLTEVTELRDETITTKNLSADWAAKTSANVDGTDFSSKEMAIGSQAGTGGSAKNWAQQTGGDVTGAATGSKSAKAYAQDNLVGADGGSAKDWAQSGALVDGTSKSAKAYSAEAQGYAATALSTTPAGYNDFNRTARGVGEIFTKTNYITDRMVMSMGSGQVKNYSPVEIQFGGTGTQSQYESPEGHLGVTFVGTGASRRSGNFRFYVSDYPEIVPGTSLISMLSILESKVLTTAASVKMILQQYNSSGTVLATATFDSASGAQSAPTLMLLEGQLVDSTCSYFHCYWDVANGETASITRMGWNLGPIAFFMPNNNEGIDVVSANSVGDLFNDVSPNLMTTNNGAWGTTVPNYNNGGGSGTAVIENFNGRSCVHATGFGSFYIGTKSLTGMKLAVGDVISASITIEKKLGDSSGGTGGSKFIISFRSGAGEVAFYASALPKRKVNGKRPVAIKLPPMVIPAGTTGINFYCEINSADEIWFSRPTLRPGTCGDYVPEFSNNKWFNKPVVSFTGVPIIDRANSVIKYPSFIITRANSSFTTVSPATYGLTEGYFTLPLGSASNSYYHYIDISDLSVNPVKSTSVGLAPTNSSENIFLGTSYNFKLYGPVQTIDYLDGRFLNEFYNGNLSNSGAGVSLFQTTGSDAAPVTAISDTVLAAQDVAYGLALTVANAGTRTGGFVNHDLSLDLPNSGLSGTNTPLTVSMLWYCSDNTFNKFSSDGPSFYVLTSTGTIIASIFLSSYETVGTNVRRYFLENYRIPAPAAGQTIRTIRLGARIGASRTNDNYFSGFIVSTQTNKIALVDKRNWQQDASNFRLGQRMRVAEASIVSLQADSAAASSIQARDAQNMARSAALKSRGIFNLQRVTAAYNALIVYGQSLGRGQETWPALSRTNKFGNKQLGGNVLPNTYDGANYSTFGSAVLNDLVAQSVNAAGTGLLSDASEAALTAGDGAFGEPVNHGWANMGKFLHNQAGLVDNDTSKTFVTYNAAVSGKTIEQLSKVNTQDATDRYSRFTDGLNKIKTAVGAGNVVVPGIAFMQGEWNYYNNGGSYDKATYKTLFAQLIADMQADTKTITGQTLNPAFLTYQTGAGYTRDVDSASAAGLHVGMAQLETVLATQGAYMVGPIYPYTDKNGHLDANGSRWFGQMIAKVWHKVVRLGQDWQPLRPIRITQSGLRDIYVDFHVPEPPLVFDTPYVVNTATSYTDKGFRVTDGAGSVTLASVTIINNTIVKITAGRDLTGTVNVWYASQTTFSGNGQLRDSDPMIAYDSYIYNPTQGMYSSANIAALVGKPYPLQNWCVAFFLPVGYTEV